MSFVDKCGKILLPLITPYKENEEVDYEKYGELINYVIESLNGFSFIWSRHLI